MPSPVQIKVETMSIPTYPIMKSEGMPMFNENRMHQGTKGNPYPVRPVLSVVREGRAPRDWEVVRMENDYIRLIIIPALGGRIFEAYDKINDYHFLYRQHSIKPALIGAYGLWISGGLEFNWPFHHRPSTFMPVNFSTETKPDGTAITWLSECDPTDRMRSTVGIVLRPDTAYFETRIQVSNRTPLRHSFLMWQNAAVSVNDDYQFIFPPDVTYANNHYSMGKPSVTYPIAQGQYSSAFYDDPTDISWYKNCFHATSHFAAPSKYDFFGGYDHGKHAGVVHIADHHVSPGKKMFTWGCGELAAQWEKALTDEDGRYCELMAGSYSNNQPDFTWLNPYETKQFSQFWYPIGETGRVSFATLDAAVRVDQQAGKLTLQTTGVVENLRVSLCVGGREVLSQTCSTRPCQPVTLEFTPVEGLYAVTLTDGNGKKLLDYTQEIPDRVQFPEPVVLDPHPATIASVQDLYLQGVHKDQYRNPQIEPCVYFEEALRRDPDHIPSLIALGEYRYRRGFFGEAKLLLEKAVRNEHIYNLRAESGEAEYLLGLTYDALGDQDKAYDTLSSAAWSGDTVSKAMCRIAAIDGRRGEYGKMLAHAKTALEYASRHPLASVYAALAAWKLGDRECALGFLDAALASDPLNDLAAYVRTLIAGESVDAFEQHRCSDKGQTALDIAFDLGGAGFFEEALPLLTRPDCCTTPMVLYTAAWLTECAGGCGKALRQKAADVVVATSYPYRLEEICVLRAALKDEKDAAARNLLACILYDKGHFAEAGGYWEEARSLQPESAVYARNLAVAWFSHLGRKKEAVDLLEQAIHLDPQNDQLKLEFLYAANKLGLPGEERLRVIRACPLAGKEKDDYTLEKAKAFCTAGKYEEALQVMLGHSFVPAEGGEMAITDLYFTILIHLGREQLKAGRPEEAEAWFRKGFDLPENFHAGLWYEAAQAPLFFYIGQALEAQGLQEQAKQEYAKALVHMLPAKADLPYYYACVLRKLNRATEARIMMSRLRAAQKQKALLPSIGWEDYTASFNSFVNDPQEQRQGMIAYQLACIAKFEGDLPRAAKLFEESKKCWPEYLNTWMELDFCSN